MITTDGATTQSSSTILPRFYAVVVLRPCRSCDQDLRVKRLHIGLLSERIYRTMAVWETEKPACDACSFLRALNSPIHHRMVFIAGAFDYCNAIPEYTLWRRRAVEVTDRLLHRAPAYFAFPAVKRISVKHYVKGLRLPPALSDKLPAYWRRVLNKEKFGKNTEYTKTRTAESADHRNNLNLKYEFYFTWI